VPVKKTRELAQMGLGAQASPVLGGEKEQGN